MATPTTYKAAFIDRDGTIIEEKNYLRDPKGVQLIPGAVDGLKKLMGEGFLLFVVSNQSGIGRGTIKQEEHDAVHAEFARQLETAGVKIESYLYCLHAPEENCPCRKPNMALIPKEWNGKPLDFKDCLVIGDKLSDLMLGFQLTASPILVLTGYGKKTQTELGSLKPKIIESIAKI